MENPTISFKGFKNLYDLLSIFPFDTVYKDMLITGGTSNSCIYSIPEIINKIKEQYNNHIRTKHNNKEFYSKEFLKFKLITSNGKLELRYKIR